MVVQSLLFPKADFSVSAAKKWAKEHKFSFKRVDITAKYIRMRQKSPGNFKDFKTINIGDSIKAVIAGNLTSRFVSSLVVKNFSKFSEHIKSEQDIQIPMKVEMRILSEGQNRDGYIRKKDLEDSLDSWHKPTVIDFHDMNDPNNPSIHKISDRKGYLGKTPYLKQIDGKWWLVNDAYITDRYLAYLIYLNIEKGTPLEISAEFGWIPYWDDGKKIQSNINPHLISIVDKGHIEGNSMTIKS